MQIRHRRLVTAKLERSALRKADGRLHERDMPPNNAEADLGFGENEVRQAQAHESWCQGKQLCIRQSMS